MLEEECVLAVDLMSIVLGSIHDIPLVGCKLWLREGIRYWFVQLGVKRIKMHLTAIQVHL